MAIVKKPVIIDPEQDHFANLLTSYALQFATKQQAHLYRYVLDKIF